MRMTTKPSTPDQSSSYQINVRSLFKEPDKETLINVAEDLLINTPQIKQYTPEELGEKLGIVWSNVPLYSVDLPEAADLLVPTQTLEEYLASQNIRLVPQEALVLCNMGETGYGLFFIGTENYREIKKGDVVFFGGVLMKYNVAEPDPTDIEAMANTDFDFFSIIIRNRNSIARADVVRSIGCFAQHLPSQDSQEFNYHKFACANLAPKEIHVGEMPFIVLEALHTIKPINKNRINCGHILGWQYRKNLDAYFDASHIKQKLFSSTGETLVCPYSYRFTAGVVRGLKTLLENLPDKPEMNITNLTSNPSDQKMSFTLNLSGDIGSYVDLAGGLVTCAKEVLFCFSRKEQEKLILYKNLFKSMLNNKITVGGKLFMDFIYDCYIDQIKVDKDELKLFMHGPNNALKCLVDEFQVVAKTFNFADWYIPIENKKNNITNSQKFSKEAQQLRGDGFASYKNALSIKDEKLKKEKLADAVSILQEALCMFRVLAELSDCSIKLFENTFITINDDIILSYWFLYKAYEALGLLPEALYFIERCLFALQPRKDDAVESESTETIPKKSPPISIEIVSKECKKIREMLANAEVMTNQVTEPLAVEKSQHSFSGSPVTLLGVKANKEEKEKLAEPKDIVVEPKSEELQNDKGIAKSANLG